MIVRKCSSSSLGCRIHVPEKKHNYQCPIHLIYAFTIMYYIIHSDMPTKLFWYDFSIITDLILSHMLFLKQFQVIKMINKFPVMQPIFIVLPKTCHWFPFCVSSAHFQYYPPIIYAFLHFLSRLLLRDFALKILVHFCFLTMLHVQYIFTELLIASVSIILG